MVGVGTSIFERPRPLSRQRRADHLDTLNCEKPVSLGQASQSDRRGGVSARHWDSRKSRTQGQPRMAQPVPAAACRRAALPTPSTTVLIVPLPAADPGSDIPSPPGSPKNSCAPRWPAPRPAACATTSPPPCIGSTGSAPPPKSPRSTILRQPSKNGNSQCFSRSATAC